MREITLGKTGITVPQNAFGALPVQRVDTETGTGLIRCAFAGGMRFFDSARAYTDSEEKLGIAFSGMRDQVVLATKTAAKTPEAFWSDLETSLKMLRTDYIDLYQFHCVPQCWRPGDGSGMYECMLEAKKQGKIRHFGVTAHNIAVAYECVESGLYETMQFPFCYLSGEKEEKLVRMCKEQNMGFIAMKGLAGGLITHSEAAMAYMLQFDNVLPIWGIQKESELTEWLAFMEKEPVMTPDMQAFIEREKQELAGDFCRGCGYCMPCPKGIIINQCARISQMIRRAPAESWLSEYWQKEMERTKACIHCGQCMKKCPYGLNTPELLKKNYADYQTFL